MSRLPAIGFATAAIVLVVDQLAKLGITSGLGFYPGDSREITGFFRLTFVQNRGVSLGLLTAGGDIGRWGLVALTAAIAIGVLVWLLREPNRQDQIGLGLVLGGAIGNILDRVRLGYVVDFADFHIGAWQPFLVFNVADAAITIGVLVLLVRALLVREGPRARAGVENENA